MSKTIQAIEADYSERASALGRVEPSAFGLRASGRMAR